MPGVLKLLIPVCNREKLPFSAKLMGTVIQAGICLHVYTFNYNFI